MCILFIWTNGEPTENGYKLVLISNRDEHYIRPAASAAEWNGYKNVFGGIDMEPGREGGTWLAISGIDNAIKVGALLNLPGEAKQRDVEGRGPIVANYVTGKESNEDYCKRLIEDPDHFNAFILVTVEISKNSSKVVHCSNAPAHIQTWPECTPLGFSNSPPQSELKKVQYGKILFEKVITEYQHDKNLLVEKCMDILKDTTKCWPDNELTKRNGAEMGELFSSICVKSNTNYGSRTRSVILIDSHNNMDYFEETMMTTDPDGEWKKTKISRQL